MARIIARLAALLVAALSLAPSCAHVLEAPPRLYDWSPVLWRETTVFHGQFALFARIGGPIDVAVIVILAILAWLMRSERPGLWFALAAASLYLVALLCWFTLVASANAVLATWHPGPIPADFGAVRTQWETGHMVVAALKLTGFIALCLAVVIPGRDGSATHNEARSVQPQGTRVANARKGRQFRGEDLATAITARRRQALVNASDPGSCCNRFREWR